jgi:hypothetical protein
MDHRVSTVERESVSHGWPLTASQAATHTTEPGRTREYGARQKNAIPVNQLYLMNAGS